LKLAIGINPVINKQFSVSALKKCPQNKPEAQYNSIPFSFTGFYLRKDIVDYTIKSQSRLMLGTRMYREPFLWKDLPKYLEKRFANAEKVNIIQGGCSVGLETRALESSLSEHLGNELSNKYRIFASDPDETSVELAKSNLICFSHKDKDIHWHQEAGIKDFSKYFTKIVGKEKIEKLETYFSLMKEGKIRNIELDKVKGEIIQTEPTNHDKSLSTRVVDLVYKVSDDLTKNTVFEKAYIQDVLKSRGKGAPCAVVLRNVSCNFNKKDRGKLAEDIYNNVEKGSVLVIGDCDLTMYRNSPWFADLIEKGFTRSSNVENTAGYYIFEKN